MTPALLDINVLVALIDPQHVAFAAAHRWFAANAAEAWATCPITENGFVRIISQPSYPNHLPPASAIELLRTATRQPSHQFWPCSPSILDGSIDPARVHGPAQITDAYLLALATERQARFVTFDQRVARSAVPAAGPDNLVVIGSGPAARG